MTLMSSLARRALALGAVTIFVLLSASASGCEVLHIELGTGDSDGSAPLPPSTIDGSTGSSYGCADWIDHELNALRAGACEGHCDASPESPYVLDDKLSVMAATAGRWAFCGDHLGPPDAIGIEFVPGCRLFFLKYDSAGVAVRGTDAAYQADYDIFDPRPAGSPARIDVHLSSTNTLTMDVEAFRCPERVTLRRGDQVLSLARLDGHGGTGQPVK